VEELRRAQREVFRKVAVSYQSSAIRKTEAENVDRLSGIDRWTRKLLAPPSSTLTQSVPPAQLQSVDSVRFSEKLLGAALGFLSTFVTALVLSRFHRLWIFPLFVVIWLAVVLNSSRRRRNYWVIGILAASSLVAIGALISSLFPWH
jgi:hypothetical protein